jgi:hypothetical protein
VKPYKSPFRRADHDDEEADCDTVIAQGILCVGLAHEFDYIGGSEADVWLICWNEWKYAVQACLNAGLVQPTLNAFRHCVEVGLKLMVPEENRLAGHNLPKLLEKATPAIPELDLPWVDALIDDLDNIDCKGDQVRYPVTADMRTPSLANLCCISPGDLRTVLIIWVEIVEEIGSLEATKPWFSTE